jgi:hypothetical protein
MFLEELEPIAAVGYPPGDEQDGNSRGYAPPERQDEVGDQAEPNEEHPEYFAFHDFILNLGRNIEDWYDASSLRVFLTRSVFWRRG